jgi:predicted PurR-regulated permease PerM
MGAVAQPAPTPFKLGTFERQGRTFVGIVLRDAVVIDFGTANSAVTNPASGVAAPTDMKDLIARYDALRPRILEIVRAVGDTRPAYVYDVTALKILPPVMPTTMLNVVISLFGVYYLLVGGGTLWVRVKRLIPLPERVSELLAVRFAEVTEALLLGTVLTALLQGTIVGVAFSLFGLHPAVFWGFVTACVSVLPLFGSSLVWLPGVAILLIERRVGAAVGLFVIGAVLASNLDNVVRLVVYRRVSGIHPMLTLVGAFAGVRWFGLAGVLIGPLVLSYFVELLGVYDHVAAHAAAAGGARPPAARVRGRETADSTAPIG